MKTGGPVAVGKIVAPHGVRGDVRILPLTDFPERFDGMKRVFTDDGRMLEVERAKPHKQFILLKFRGFDDMNTVEPLRGKLLNVSRDELVPLPEGHYYVFDIIGLDVYSEEGEFLGNIADVLHTGSNDVYVAEAPERRPLLIPALKEVVRSIDVPGGRMVVRLQEEWSQP